MATSFPDTYRDIGTSDLISIYAEAPERLGSVVDGLTVSERLAQPVSGKWSIQQITLHLADAEIMGAARIRQVIAEPGCNFVVYDQDAWADEIGYQQAGDKTFYSAVMLFDALRLTTAKIFAAAEQDDWNKSGIHPEWGELNLRQLLEIYADHGERHTGQILERRRMLGKPLDLPLLLPERLY
jgi:uncharacterized damage-inducible protein DinB